ncbi:hypothetical protein PFISCL1PPCAC_4311, partial [Pristionchus fissidentatus]
LQRSRDVRVRGNQMGGRCDQMMPRVSLAVAVAQRARGAHHDLARRPSTRGHYRASSAGNDQGMRESLLGRGRANAESTSERRLAHVLDRGWNVIDYWQSVELRRVCGHAARLEQHRVVAAAGDALAGSRGVHDAIIADGVAAWESTNNRRAMNQRSATVSTRGLRVATALDHAVPTGHHAIEHSPLNHSEFRSDSLIGGVRCCGG